MKLHTSMRFALKPVASGASLLVASRDDPYCSFERAAGFAQAWVSRLVDAGARGHLNAESGLGDWPEGHALLQSLLTT